MDNCITLARQDALKIDFIPNASPNGTLAITFTERTNSTLEGGGFCFRYLSRLGFDVVCVKSVRDDWYDGFGKQETATVNQFLADLGRPFARRVGLGSSMGGHAVIRYAAALQLDRVLAFSPPYDIRLPWEPRWKADLAAVTRARMMGPEDLSAECRYHFVFDPRDPDARHVALFEQDIPAQQRVRVEVPYMGHPAGFYFAQTQTLEALIKRHLLSDGPFDAVEYPARQQAARERSHTYLFGLAQACLARGRPKMALSLNTAALALQAGHLEYRRQRCRILVALGRLPEALELGEQVVTGNPAHSFRAWVEDLRRRLAAKPPSASAGH